MGMLVRRQETLAIKVDRILEEIVRLTALVILSRGIELICHCMMSF